MLKYSILYRVRIILSERGQGDSSEEHHKGGTDLDFLEAGTGRSLNWVEVGNCCLTSLCRNLLLPPFTRRVIGPKRRLRCSEKSTISRLRTILRDFLASGMLRYSKPGTFPYGVLSARGCLLNADFPLFLNMPHVPYVHLRGNEPSWASK